MDEFIKGAQGAGQKAEKLCLRGKNIAPCLACEACLRNGGTCVQKDDMPQILEKARKADRIALFSPIYWWQMTAQEKLIVDRLYPLSEADWNGKVLTVVMNGAAEDDDREFSLLHDQFREMADYIKAELRFLGVGTSDDEAFGKALAKVRNLAASK